MSVVIEYVTQYQCSAVEPWYVTQSAHVWFQDKVTIAFGPTGRLVAWHWFHSDIVGQQIVATVSFGVTRVYEESGVKSFADQSPLHVDKTYKNGIYATGGNRFLEFINLHIVNSRCDAA
jgi:hypothetical protein